MKERALVAVTVVLLAAAGCVEGAAERPVACDDVLRVVNSLEGCVRGAPDLKTREGCFAELKVVCRFGD